DLVDASDIDTYTVYLRAGEHYDFVLRNGDDNIDAGPLDPAATKLTLTGAIGRGVSAEGSETAPAVLSFTPLVSGTYTLTAQNLGTPGFEYDLVVRNTSYDTDIADYVGNGGAGEARLTVGAALVADIEHAGDTDYVAVNLVAGTKYTFSAQG